MLNFVDEGVNESVDGIPIVHRYKYLSIYFDDTMKPQPHLAKKLSKFQRVCINLRI